MTDYLPPIGFWSYTSSDEDASGGRLSQLRALLAKELQLKVGREPKVHIFQDVAAIPHGANWAEAIHKALAESSFFIPIVTPAFLQSEWCCREVMRFHERQQASGRKDLIFPLHYVDTDRVNPDRPGACHDPQAFAVLKTHQWIDFRPLRIRSPESEPVSELLDRFSDSIWNALCQPVPPSPRPAALLRDGSDLPEMVSIPAGTYMRGVPEAESQREDADDDAARPVRRVTVPSFWMGRYPVTRGEFAALVRKTGYKTTGKAETFELDAKGIFTWEERTGRDWRNPGFQQTDRHPVVCISHDDAMAYIDWLNARAGGGYRLPSEAEWEYAARAGTATARYWGDGREGAKGRANVADRSLVDQIKATFDEDEFFDFDDGFPFTAPVDAFPANGFGLHDMLGNAWEWCADYWHADYNGAPDDGSAWETGDDSGWRVLRGGSWYSYPQYVRAGVRNGGVRGNRNCDIGFRLSRTLSAPTS